MEETNRLATALKELADWQTAFAQSGYGKAHPPTLDVAGPEPLPFIALKQPAGKALAPCYGKLQCERQVDHWESVNYDVNIDGLKALGRPRSAFPPSLVVGSPQAQAFLAAQRETLAKAKAAREQLQREYAATILEATQPGTLYRGRVIWSSNWGSEFVPGPAATVEVRFRKRPEGGEQAAAFELTLPEAGDCRLAFTATLASSLPAGPSEPAVQMTADLIDAASPPNHRARSPEQAHIAALMVQGFQDMSVHHAQAKFPIEVTGSTLDGLVCYYMLHKFRLEVTRVDRGPAPLR